MNRIGQALRVGVPLVLFSALLLLAAVPQSYIPGRLAPVLTASARFAEKPIRLAVPRSGLSDVAATFRIKMDQGVCEAFVKRGTELKRIFSMGEGTCRGRVPSDGEIILDPQGNAGEYDLTIGAEWHPLGPKGRRFILLPMALSLMLGFIFAGKLGPQAASLGTKRLLYAAGITAMAGAVLYPIAHEGGHLVFGVLFGATPDWHNVAWTALGGEEPHVGFRHLPEGAAPFMSAGGPILPTLISLLLLLMWRLFCRPASWYSSTALLLVAVLFLFSTLGCLFELYGNTHMDALSVHWGLAGLLRVVLSLSPLLVALGVYVWLALRFRKQKLATRAPHAAA